MKISLPMPLRACCVLVCLLPAAMAAPGVGIGIDDDGRLFTVTSATDAEGGALLEELARQVGLQPDELLIALTFYMEREQGVEFHGDPDRAYYRALIEVAAKESGLDALLAAVAAGRPLPPTPLAFYIVAVRNALQSSGAGEKGKDLQCGACGENDFPYPGCEKATAGPCLRGCGTGTGSCWEVDSKIAMLELLFSSY